jgi:phosphoserine aminotransferase
MRKWNFCAGPAVISEEVLEEVKSELLEYNNSGASIMEVSHRSKLYSSVAVEAKQDLIDILNIPKNYDVLFLQGGATHQFSMVPYNFGNSSGGADYILSGSWSKKAISEASKITKVNTIASSEAKNYCYAPDPKAWKISENSAYVHYCPNETIQGVAIHEAPNLNKPIISDASSVILSEPLDVSKFSLIYAGAQKNIGPAGLTIVIIDKDFMELGNQKIPNILKYSEHSIAESMLNTPPTFAWYMAGKVFKWIKEKGGLEFFKQQNYSKASKLYQYIDSSDFYSNNIDIENRSIMNVTFFLENDELDSPFLLHAEENGLLNLKGHRSVGGMRASIYNAMPLEGVEELIKYMKYFESKYG